MAEISRALQSAHYDRAFVLASELSGRPKLGAAFLLESGVPLVELPVGALRAIAGAKDPSWAA
jgi:hypothetical protein